MAPLAIRTESLSKQYRIGARLDTSATLRDAVARWASATAGRLRPGADDGPRERQLIWALDDVSLDIEQGEVVGIIGRNGAGKTTLLKILSRITEPTSGRARIKGRVGSLLEVGTGFHQELTGRENVYLSGSILGMRKAEIDRRFDEIVEFAGVETFLETPVKRYSTGMAVRLAFAVAAHLEPEILLVDEVLAVGDAAFQRKSLGRMSDVAREGRTVLFVSHNMAVMQALCRRGVLIDQGRVTMDGPIEQTVGAYLHELEQAMSTNLLERTDTRGWLDYRVSAIDISSTSADTPHLLVTGRPARFVFHVTEAVASMHCSFTVYDALGHPVTQFRSGVSGAGDSVDPSLQGFVCDIDELLLLPGRYRIDVELWARGVQQEMIEGAAAFEVSSGTVDGRAVHRRARGSVVLRHSWKRPLAGGQQGDG
jgi:lipopolysaccharide transport system ATP-binding protein